MENIFWKGFSDDERHAAIHKIQSVVTKYGDIIDFHFFSDLSLSMTIEIEEDKIDMLYGDLNGIIGLQGHGELHSIVKKERTIYLNITFARGSGRHEIEVPLVPG